MSLKSTLWAVPLVMAISCQTVTEPELTTEPEPPEPYVLRVDGYHAWWSGDAWLSYDFSSLDAIYFFDLSVDDRGEVSETNGWPEQWGGLIAAAEAANTPVIPTLSVLDAGTFISLFSDSTAVDTLTARAVAIATAADAGGVHIDFEVFEPVPDSVRSAFHGFIEDLAAAVRAADPDAEVSVFTLATDPGDAYDEAALAAAVDRLVVQAYDMHWQTAPTSGPVAPLDGWNTNWHSILAGYRAQDIPLSKLSFGLPYYGYEWPTDTHLPGSPTRGPALELAYLDVTGDRPSARERADIYGKLRDTSSGSPYYAYRDSTGWYQGWFEDDFSLEQKYRFVTDNRIGGATVFPLAYGDASLSRVLLAARLQFSAVPDILPGAP